MTGASREHLETEVDPRPIASPANDLARHDAQAERGDECLRNS